MGERLRLRAEDAADLPPLSALVQDMTVQPADISFDARARRLVLLGNRYRWEAPDSRSRIRTALRLDFVDRLQQRAMPADPHAVLALLAISMAEDALLISFSGGTSLRAQVEVVDLTLEDISGPWGARATPRHAV